MPSGNWMTRVAYSIELRLPSGCRRARLRSINCTAAVTSRPAATVPASVRMRRTPGSARSIRGPEGSQATGLEEELGQRTDDQANRHRLRPKRSRQYQDADDNADVVDGRGERWEPEAVLGVERGSQHARQALEDHRNERDAHQIDGQQS